MAAKKKRKSLKELRIHHAMNEILNEIIPSILIKKNRKKYRIPIHRDVVKAGPIIVNSRIYLWQELMV